MRAVIQRVSRAAVTVDGRTTGAIGPGLLILLGTGQLDDERSTSWMVDKILNLRIFEDQAGKMNLSLLQTGGQLLVVSQFTLFGDCRKGRRPSFVHAQEPTRADELYRLFVARARELGVTTETGEFGAKMAVELVNDGPVTLLVDSEKMF